jgi:hypothetical protein
MRINVREWVKDASECGYTCLTVANRQIAQEYRIKHSRSGRIPASVSREAAKANILAYGVDELGNFWVLCIDGISRQFFRN